MLKNSSAIRRCFLQPERWLSPTRFSTTTSSKRKPKGIDKGTTVDMAEVETFSRDADTWWNPNGPMKALHAFNKIRVPFIIGDQNACQKSKILDIGCGGGLLTEALAKYGEIVNGVDYSQELIDIAKHHTESNRELKTKPTYYCTSIEDHVKQFQNYYDIVVASEVIEHITNKDLFVTSCLLALKLGGSFIITCPSKTRLSQFVNIVFAENVVNTPPKGTHQYEKFISKQDLQLLLEKKGCHVQEIRGFAYNMMKNKWTVTRTTSLFYGVRAIKVR